MWAEKTCRGELRAREAWPAVDDPKALAIATQKVANLTKDRRLIAELAAACQRGAARWWEGRPARYRV